MPSLSTTPSSNFYGNTVVRAAFVLALFGWGVGFYSPPVFLHAVLARTGWSLALVSAAVTFHFLLGAAVVACLPRIHRRLGIPATTMIGAAAPIIMRNRDLCRQLGIPDGNKPAIALIIGYPAVRFRRGVTRHFASVTTLGSGSS